MFFVALSLCGFLYIGIPFNRVYLVYIAFAMIILCSFFCRNAMQTIKNNRFLVIYIICVLLITIAGIIYTRFTYGQNFTKSLGVSYPYFMVLYAIPILCIYIDKGNDPIGFELLNIFALIWYIMCFAQVLLYPRIIIPGYFSSELNPAAYFRDGSLRIDLQLYGNFMIVYNFQGFYVKGNNKKHRLFHLFMTALGLYELIFIQQTRMYTLAILCCFLVIVLLDKSNNVNGFARKILVLILGIGALFQTSLISNIINSIISTNSALSASTTARMYSIEYYFSYYLKHPIFGMSFPNGTDYFSIVHGPIGYASFDDVGVVGQLARLGIFVIIVYLVLMIRYLRILIRVKRYLPNENFMLCLSFYMYLLFTSFSLIFLDPQRCLLYPLSLAFFEYENIIISS